MKSSHLLQSGVNEDAPSAFFVAVNEFLSCVRHNSSRKDASALNLLVAMLKDADNEKQAISLRSRRLVRWLFDRYGIRSANLKSALLVKDYMERHRSFPERHALIFHTQFGRASSITNEAVVNP